MTSYLPKPNTILRRWEADHAADPTLTMEQHAVQMCVPFHAYIARLNEAKSVREIQGKCDFSLGQPLKLEGDWMIVGDIHVPFTDYDWANLVTLVAKKHMRKPRRLLIAGDFFNMDTFSTYAHLTNIPTWAEERKAAKGLLDEWLDVFAEVRVLMGNHDRRLQKFTGGAFDETDIMALVISNPERVLASNYGWCTIESGGQVYRVTHPKNYGINQLTVADTLAQKYDVNILSFHEHHLSLGWDRYKRHLIINGGCLVDQDKLAYVALDDSKSAGMAKGFVMLRGGCPVVFGETPFTDWGAWLK